MQARITDRFYQSYRSAPLQIRKAFDKRLEFLLRDLRHPSLRAKKYDQSGDLWQARVTESWRFYFRIDGDTYVPYFLEPHRK